MARTNDSTKATEGSAKAYDIHPLYLKNIADTLYIRSETNSPSSNNSSNDHSLARYRLALFLSNNNTSTLPFHLKHDAAEQDIIHAAKKRMEAKLLAFDIAFSKYTEGISSGSSSKQLQGSLQELLHEKLWGILEDGYT